VRHMLRLQVIVLRYVKALLVTVITAVALFACAAAVNARATISAADERWIAGVMSLWAPTVLIVVSSPVRWLESLLRTEGAQHSAVSRDKELTQLEEVTERVAGVSWVVSVAAMVVLLVHHTVSTQGTVAVSAALAGSGALALVAIDRRRAKS